MLSSSLDYELTLQRVAEMAVPGLADWCGVSMPDSRGQLRQVAVAHVDPSKTALAREIAARLNEVVARESESDDDDGAAGVLVPTG